LERGIFSLQLHKKISELLTKGWVISYSLTIGAIEHIFEFLEREFHCEYFMFCKFVDLMSRTWVN